MPTAKIHLDQFGGSFPPVPMPMREGERERGRMSQVGYFCHPGLVTITPMGILIIYRDRLWQFRVLSSDGAIYGHTSHYYTLEAAETAGRQWVGAGW